jgi:hypothetical protein
VSRGLVARVDPVTRALVLVLVMGGAVSVLATCGDSEAVRGAAGAIDATGVIDASDAPVVDAPAVDASPFDAPPGVPDLQLVGGDMARSWLVNAVYIPDGDCAVTEGCVGASGTRVLLRFATITANRGTGDLIVGVPPDAGVSNDTFQWSACHKHHHVANYATYELLDDQGVVITARKQSFCLEDDKQVQVGAQPTGYSCQNQGISRGWADVYTAFTACQWIDVTDVAHGAYTLRVTVNPLKTITESSYDNNVFTVSVSF